MRFLMLGRIGGTGLISWIGSGAATARRCGLETARADWTHRTDYPMTSYSITC